MSDRVVLGVGVSGVGGNDVADPAERAAGANPEAGRDDQPEDSREPAAVVNLADAGNKKTQKSCGKWIAHRSYPLKSTAKFHTTMSSNLFRLLGV